MEPSSDRSNIPTMKTRSRPGNAPTCKFRKTTEDMKTTDVTISMTAFLALVVVVAFWVKRYLLIATTMTRGVDIGRAYFPTWVESSIIIGTFAIPIFMYAVFLKLFPIIELGVVHDMERAGADS